MAERMFYCDRTDSSTGLPCTVSSKRRANLIRHIDRKHKESLNGGFFQYVVDSHGILQKGKPEVPAAVLTPLAAKHATPSELTSNANFNFNFEVSAQSQERNLNTDSENPSPTDNGSPLAQTANSVTQSVNPSPSPILSRPLPSPHAIFLDLSPGTPLQDVDVISNEHDVPVLNSEDATEQTTDGVRLARPPWQQRKDKIRKRLCESFEKEDHPVYQVKRSKKWHNQQRAIAWITYAAKSHFDHHFSSILAQWGVKPTHTGTCLLLPADWAALDPIRLAALFSPENCPHAWADGVTYQYDDHTTSLTRATAWFADTHWPRDGSELVNFLGNGPYKPKQGSHLCHHHLCLTHLVFESVEENEDRKECHARAKFLRQEGLPIPRYCTKHAHKRPCLMQHAALTTLEAFLIQFFVLLKAKGQASLATPPRPRWHPYPTFECQLPLTFCDEAAVNLEPEDIVSEVIESTRVGKPELKCQFCSGIKAFKSIIALWSHFVHQHYKSENSAWMKVVVEENLLLEEVRRTAGLWRTYWREHSDGGKRRDPTMMKLLQVDDVNFTWVDILEWKLR
ncbi:hypothetical protein BGZ57DRAFT_922836 [Hyaloscypha finlandica]|nr:hypothetical protein BGZ57DRAFT_922836 [Hyaloscypha finlandica]